MSKRIICPQCKYIGKPRRRRHGRLKGSLTSGMLLFPFNIPYIMWRLFRTTTVCKSCGNEVLIDADSIVGQRLLAQWEKNPRLFRPDTKSPEVI